MSGQSPDTSAHGPLRGQLHASEPQTRVFSPKANPHFVWCPPTCCEHDIAHEPADNSPPRRFPNFLSTPTRLVCEGLNGSSQGGAPTAECMRGRRITELRREERQHCRDHQRICTGCRVVVQVDRPHGLSPLHITSYFGAGERDGLHSSSTARIIRSRSKAQQSKTASLAHPQGPCPCSSIAEWSERGLAERFAAGAARVGIWVIEAKP